MANPTKKENQAPLTIDMIVEGNSGSLWGRVHFDDNLIVDCASDLLNLKAKMKALLLEFHGLNPFHIDFRVEYDVTALFEEFDFLNISKVADISGLNQSLLRQYATGKKFPSAKQAAKIESAFQEIAARLTNVHIHTGQ